MSMEEIKIQSLIETLHLCAPECPQGRWSRDSAVESPEGRVSLAVEEGCCTAAMAQGMEGWKAFLPNR